MFLYFKHEKFKTFQFFFEVQNFSIIIACVKIWSFYANYNDRY